MASKDKARAERYAARKYPDKHFVNGFTGGVTSSYFDNERDIAERAYLAGLRAGRKEGK